MPEKLKQQINWANPTFEADIRSLYRLRKILEENDNHAE